MIGISSPFGKGGPRGICLSLLIVLLLTASTAFAQSGADPDPPSWFQPVDGEHRHSDTEMTCIQSWDDLLRLLNLAA